MQEFLSALDAHQEAVVALSLNGARFIPGDNRLVVTFQAFVDSDDPEQRSPRSVWAENFLHKRGYSVLGVNHRRNNWYRASDLHQLLRAMQARGFFARFRQVCFYGGSMGGFAALAFAELAPGCTVIAHNPQTTLRPADTPWETRYDEARSYEWDGEFSDGAVGARYATRVYVSYDPFHVADRLHVARLDSANLVPLRVPMVGHLMPIWLQQMRILGTVFDMAMAGTLSSAGFVPMARARFMLPHYLISLAQRSRSPALKQFLGEKARGIAPQLPTPKSFLWGLQTADAPRPPQRPTPLVIWTLAGCRADELLAGIRRLQPGWQVLFEPFNGTGRPHDLTALMKRPSHGPMVLDEIERLMTGTSVIVHRVHAETSRFDQALMKASTAHRADHLILHRRDTAARLLDGSPDHVGTILPPPGAPALDLPPSVAAARQALSLLSTLEAALVDNGATCLHLATEALDPALAGPQDAQAVASVFPRLGFAGVDPDAFSLAPEPGQAPTAQVRTALPPIPLALAVELAWVPTLDEGESVVRPAMATTEYASAVSLDQLAPAFREGIAFTLSGLAVKPPPAPQHTRLFVRQGGMRQDGRWGQASPGGPARFPGHPDATKTRFGHATVNADPAQPITLEVTRADGSAPLELARIEFHTMNGRQRIDGLFLAPWSIGFRPVPGAASLALSVALHRLLRAHFRSTTEAAKDTDLPAYYESRWSDVSGAAVKLAVVRDPVDRFITLFHRKLADAKLSGGNLPRSPSLTAFIDHFDDYLAQSPLLARSFASQVTTLKQPEAFQHLYRLDALADLRQELQKLTGHSLELPAAPGKALFQRLGWSGPPRAAIRWIQDRYADDMALWERLG